MSKGRNSTQVSIRLADEVATEMERRGRLKGLSLGGYIKYCIERSVCTTDLEAHSATTIEPHSATTTKPLEIYNPAVHKAGDRVLIRKGKQLVETIVPELDAGGNPVPQVF